MDWVLITRICASTGLFALGGVFLKVYADTAQSWSLWLSLATYALGCFLFAAVLRHGLGFGTVLATMLELSALVVIGGLFFGERLGTAQFAGLACAVGAMVLFSLPTNAR